MWQANLLQNVVPHGLEGFGAKAFDPARSIIARERGKINAADGSREPGGLMIFFDRAPCGQAGAAPLNGRGIGLNGKCPIQIKRQSWIAWLECLRQLRNCGHLLAHKPCVHGIAWQFKHSSA
jgi:hypothetical protein